MKMVKVRSLKTSNFNYWAFIVSSLILLALAIFSLIWFQKQKEASHWITHTYQVKLKIEQSFSMLLEAESNQRGYLINHDSSFLENIHHADSLLKLNLSQLDALVADNPSQVQSSKNLQLLMSARTRKLHALLDSPQLFHRHPFSHFVSPGKVLMDSIYDKVKTMESEEDTLLEQRTSFKETQDTWVIVFILLFSLLAFTILMWSFFKIRNENRLRLRAQYDVDILDKLVNERTVEIKHINDLLTEQNTKLERKNRDLTSFTNIASHDLKEPLRKINMFIGMIHQANPEFLTDRSREYFEKISNQSKRMQILIDSILQYAQTDDDTEGFKQTNLTETANFALESLSEKIKEKNATIQIQPLPTIYGNPSQMEQLFINFIDNGLKYSRPGIPPFLEITAAEVGETDENGLKKAKSWKIDFSDNGIGFEETYGEKIFEIFQRLHTSDQYPGTGIGLAICKKIVENHHGTIVSRSVVGKGSTFSVILPANLV